MPPLIPGFRRFLHLSAILGLTTVAGAQVEEFVPIEDVPADVLQGSGADVVEDGVADRVEGSVDENAWIPPRETPPYREPQREGFRLGVEMSVAYNDNIFLSATAPEADFVSKVTPSIVYAKGDPGAGGGFMEFAYRPSAVIFVENSGENRVDHDTTLTVGYDGAKTAIVYRGAYRRLGDATPETGARADRSEYASEVRATWKATAKVDLEAAIAVEGADYDDATLSDSNSTTAELAVRYAYSEKTELGVEFSSGSVEVDGAPKQDFQRVVTRLTWKPREKWAVNIGIGAEKRDYSTGSDTFGVFDAQVDWTPREGTSLFAAAYRREDVSAVFAGQNIEITGFKAGIRQKLAERWEGVLEAGYEIADYKAVSAGAVGGRSDGIVFIQPSVEYTLSDRFKMGMFYRYGTNDSNQAAFGYDNHQIGLNLKYEF